MAGKTWTPEQRQKIAEAKAKSKEPIATPAPIKPKKVAAPLVSRAIPPTVIEPAYQEEAEVYNDWQDLDVLDTSEEYEQPVPEPVVTKKQWAVDTNVIRNISNSKLSPNEQAAAIDRMLQEQQQVVLKPNSGPPAPQQRPQPTQGNRPSQQVYIQNNRGQVLSMNPVNMPAQATRESNIPKVKINSKIPPQAPVPRRTKFSGDIEIDPVSPKEFRSEPVAREDNSPEHLKDMSGAKISLLFPCFSNTNAATTWALVQTAKRYGAKLRMDMESGDSMIVNSRNKLANRFVESGIEWSVWLDDDMIPQTGNPAWFRYMTFCDEWADSMKVKRIPDDMLEAHFIDRLLSHGQKLVGCTYFGRQFRGRPMFDQGVNTVEGNRHARVYPNELLETEWVGTGCLLVHRDVYTDMQEAYPELAPTQSAPFWDFFRVIPGHGEDASFCIRAKSVGHQPRVDLGLHFAHVGKAAYGAWNTNNRQLGV